MKKSPENNCKRWTIVEIRKLKQMAEDKIPIDAIAAELGRTKVSVQSKAVNERISVRIFDKPKMTVKEWKAMKKNSL